MPAGVADRVVGGSFALGCLKVPCSILPVVSRKPWFFVRLFRLRFVLGLFDFNLDTVQLQGYFFSEYCATSKSLLSFLHLVAGIELKILRCLVACVSVQRRDRHLAQLSITSICYLLLHRVSVQRRDRCTVIVFLCEFLHSQSVSVRSRDRSLPYLCFALLRYRFFHLRGSAFSL